MKLRWILLALALTATPRGEALAQSGVVLAPTLLSAKERAVLAGSVSRARVATPAAFVAVRSIRDRAGVIDARRRGRLAPFGSMFKALGPDALLPMLEMVALDAPPRGDLTESAWTGLRAGLLEAVGSLRDPAAEPVLLAVLEGPERDPVVVRAAAEALAKLGTDRAAARLVALAQQEGPRRQAVVSGMGAGRRVPIVEALAHVVRSARDPGLVLAAVRSLGDAGSSWAWKTSEVRRFGAEERQVRAIAARALVDAFVTHDGAVRTAAATALLVVDEPGTEALLEGARAVAAPEVAAALEVLRTRFASNPAR